MRLTFTSARSGIDSPSTVRLTERQVKPSLPVCFRKFTAVVSEPSAEVPLDSITQRWPSQVHVDSPTPPEESNVQAWIRPVVGLTPMICVPELEFTLSFSFRSTLN